MVSELSRSGKTTRFLWDVVALAFRMDPVRTCLVIASHVLANIANVAAPWFLGMLVAGFAGSDNRDAAAGITVAVLIYVLLFFGNMALRNFAIPHVERIKLDLETNLSLRELSRSFTCSSGIRTAVSDAEVTWAVQNAGRAAALAWENFVYGPLTAVVGILAGLVMVTNTGGWLTGGIFLLACVAYVVVSIPLVRRHRDRSGEFVGLDSDLHSHTVDVVSLWREAKIFRVHGWLEEYFLRLRRSLTGAGLARARATRNLYLAQSLILSITMLALVYSVAKSGTHGSDLVGDIVAVCGICTASIMSLQSLGFGFSAIVQAQTQWAGALAVLNPTNESVDAASRDFADLVTCVQGRPTWIIGQSGAGKSTLLEGLLGLRGDTSQLDRIVTPKGAPKADRVAYLPQENRLIGASVEDNIRLGRQAGDTDALLRRLGLGAFAERGERRDEPLNPSSSSTSGGESRRIALLRTLVDASAELIILDEPTAGLDRHWSDVVWELILERAKDTPMIIATHDPRAPRSESDVVVRVEPQD